jgi:hypothetical protein
MLVLVQGSTVLREGVLGLSEHVKLGALRLYRSC